MWRTWATSTPAWILTPGLALSTAISSEIGVSLLLAQTVLALVLALATASQCRGWGRGWYFPASRSRTTRPGHRLGRCWRCRRWAPAGAGESMVGECSHQPRSRGARRRLVRPASRLHRYATSPTSPIPQTRHSQGESMVGECSHQPRSRGARRWLSRMTLGGWYAIGSRQSTTQFLSQVTERWGDRINESGILTPGLALSTALQ